MGQRAGIPVAVFIKQVEGPRARNLRPSPSMLQAQGAWHQAGWPRPHWQPRLALEHFEKPGLLAQSLHSNSPMLVSVLTNIFFIPPKCNSFMLLHSQLLATYPFPVPCHFAFLRMSYKWTNAAPSLAGLASCTQHKASEVLHPSCCTCGSVLVITELFSPGQTHRLLINSPAHGHLGHVQFGGND